MPEIEMTGKTVEDAINKGLETLGCERKNTDIKILDEGATGLFGLMGAKPARVLISAESADCKKSVPIEIDSKKAIKKVESILTEILKKMNIKLKEIKSSFENDSVNIEFSVDEGSFVIGKGGQTLDSLEYITQIITNNVLNTKIKVNLDCENYRLKQNERLKVMTDKAIEYVKRTKKIYRFDPMSAKERKIIHTYLKDNPAIESFSEGEGVLRKVGIKLSNKKSV